MNIESLRELPDLIRKHAQWLANADVSAIDNLGVIDSRLKALEVSNLLSAAAKLDKFLSHMHVRPPRTVTPRH